MKLQIAGIKRSPKYSPNQTTNDTLIFMQTVERLTELGINVRTYEEFDLGTIDIKENLIFSMAQGIKGVIILSKMEEQGKVIVNSPKGSINCYRGNMVKILQENNIQFPKSLVVTTDEKDRITFNDFNVKKIWAKRGDVHAVHREDVTLVYSEDERKNIFHEFEKRGIKEIVLQEHLYGDVIKFYGIIGSDFFHWYYLNGVNHNPFDEKRLLELATESAKIIGLEIFGGDAVISDDGTISIIDINDWPSFAPVRNEASKQISNLIFNKVKKLKIGVLINT